jgi:membrane fusion protein, multidrug efflux system
METTRMDHMDVDEERSTDQPIDAEAAQPVATTETPWWQRWWIWAFAVVALVAIAAVAAALFAGGGEDGNGEASRNTAAVQRMDLVVTEELSGTLGYGDAKPITFRSSDDGVTTIDGGLNGTVTSIVAAGSVVEPGDVLYEVDTEPVVVLAGSLPAYRAFNSRMSDGPDVEQLEQALVDLGYDPNGTMTVDEDFTSATAAAVERLQADIGAEEDGTLNLGEVVFTPDGFYVAETLADVGSAVGNGTPIIATSRAPEGTVTSIAAEGSVVGQGGELLTLDGEPVVLLIGAVPAYRALLPGVSGDDVRQLEEALSDAGYGGADDFVVDGVFDEASRAAVLSWQTDIGAAPDGVVNVGDVIFSPSPIRIGENLVDVGDLVRDGTPIMSTSVDSTFVSVELSTDDQDLVSVGDAVVVVLPDGTRESASVTEIGTVVQANQNGGTYFEMTVTLDDPTAAPGLDEAPVDVEIAGDSASGVLAVPVTALIALAEGGYAVEVVNDDGTTVLIGVDPGLFADGRVEVVGEGLADGMLVVVP